MEIIVTNPETQELAKETTNIEVSLPKESINKEERVTPDSIPQQSKCAIEQIVPVPEKKISEPVKLNSVNRVFEEVVSKPKAKVESSSSSSDSTLRQSSFALLNSTTTTSETETLKQVRTPESETVDDNPHFRRIQAVEPLVQVNKARVLEEVIPYVIKPPPELVPGSAIEKLYSVEKRGVGEVILTDFQVGVEVNVEVGNEMSRRYTSSAG